MLFWHAATNRWAAKIGFKHTKSGNRTNAVFYFAGPPGTPTADIVTDATNKKREWQGIVGQWDAVRPILESLREIDGNALEYSKPVWFDRDALRQPDADEIIELKEARVAEAEWDASEAVQDIGKALDRGAATETVVASLRAAGVLPKGILAPSRKATVREAIGEYLEHERQRTTKKIGSRITAGTYNTNRNNLLLAVGCTIAKDWTQTTPLLDLDRQLVTLTNADLKGIADHWFTLPGDVTSRRTVLNYFAGLRAFLNWCDLQDEFGFTKPKATTKLLHVVGANEPNVTEANYDLLARCLSDAPERTKLYTVLGLFCGFYQADICSLTTDEVTVVNGETFITGFRSKESAESKAKTKIKTTHWIPPQVADLMTTHKAPANAQNFYFLNKHGRPMFSEKLEGGKSNAVSKAWEKVMAHHNDAPTFKQLRKWAWNEIQLYADTAVDPRCVGEVMAKRWAGQTGGGVSASYRFDDYRPVIAAQRKWWDIIGLKLGF